MSIKSNWERRDETCPNCGQVTKRVRGITKQNLKRLITPQFNMTEILITFMLIMVLVLAWAYNTETKECREWLGSFSTNVTHCKDMCNLRCEALQSRVLVQDYYVDSINLTKLNITP